MARKTHSVVSSLGPVEAATLLQKLAPEILQRWEDCVRAEVRAARSQDRLTLFDEIPVFLARIALMLNGEMELRGDDTCREHGEQRAQEAHYVIDAVMLEYRLLRKTIVQVLEEEAPLGSEAREAICDCIELAMQRSAERFVQVQQSVLNSRAVALELADRRKDEFVAVLAHELRTPLSAVSNALYILENAELGDRGVHQLDSLRRQVASLSRLVHDVTDMTVIRQGKIELQREVIDLRVTAQNAADSVLPFIETRGQDLVVTAPTEPVRIDADPLRIEQVVANLLNNAARYTQPGGSIWMTVEQDDSMAVLRVKDTGTGIDGLMLPQIFDLFTQASRRSGTNRGSLGIGLALVKQFVELHGGSVTAFSEGENQGAEFVVRLPLAS